MNLRGVKRRAAVELPIAHPVAKRRPFLVSDNWSEFSEEFREHYAERDRQDQIKRTVFSRDVASADRLHQERLVAGDRILAEVRKIMGSFGLVRTKPLRQIQDACIISNLHFIFGKDFVKSIPKLLKMFTVEELYQMWVLTTMRQAGKTTAVQSSAAALILVLMRFKMVVFAPTKRQSIAVMVGVVDFIRKIDRGQARVVRQNQEELVVTPFPAGDPSKANLNNSVLRCLPASEKGLRILSLCLFVFVYDLRTPLSYTHPTDAIKPPHK